MKVANFNAVLSMLLGCALLAWACSPCWGGPSCVSGTNVRVCVAWSQVSVPEAGVDFRVTYSGGGIPSVVLVSGDIAWEVYAEVIATGDPADIASITIDPSSSSENFIVALTNNGEPGAANLGDLDLTAASWSGFASLATGSVIAGDLTGDIALASAGGNGGVLELEVQGHVSGDIAAESVGEFVVGGDLTGRLTVRGDMDGKVLVSGDLGGTGRIYVNGALRDTAEFYQIEIVGDIGSDAAIVIDADGWDGDEWESLARIGSYGHTFSETDPNFRVWHVTRCKGDLNNDGDVNFYDINPFLAALFEPGDYEALYPGLESSRVYHADLGGGGEDGSECNDATDFFDVDYFFERVFDECCNQACGSDACTYFGPGDALPPEDLAAILTATATPKHIAALVDLYLVSSEALPSERSDFWSEVIAALPAD